MQIYISSMMTGLPNDNFEAFDKVAKELSKLGYRVVNPANISRELIFRFEEIEKAPSRKDYLVADIDRLMDCEAIAMFGNWWMSNGAMLEYHIARELGLQIYQYDSELGLRRMQM
jgi:hypothetical protein